MTRINDVGAVLKSLSAIDSSNKKELSESDKKVASQVSRIVSGEGSKRNSPHPIAQYDSHISCAPGGMGGTATH